MEKMDQTIMKPDEKPHYKAKASIILGVLQIIIGGLGLVLGIAAATISAVTSGGGGFARIALVASTLTAISGCVLLITIGAFGIVAGKTRRIGFITVFLVLSLLAAAQVGLSIVLTSILKITAGAPWPDIVLLIIALGELVIAIISVVICCQAL